MISTNFSSSLQTSASQLGQLVQAERTKQYFLVNEAAAAVASAAAAAGGSYSSAARITPASSSKPPSAASISASGPGGAGPSSSGLSKPDAPAVIISERDKHQLQLAQKMLTAQQQNYTAQNVIDAIITQSIQQGVPGASASGGPGDGSKSGGLKLGGQSQEDLLVKATLAAKAQQEAAQAQAVVAAAHAAQAAAVAASGGSRPPSSHDITSGSSSTSKPNLPPDMMLNRELSITPAPPSSTSGGIQSQAHPTPEELMKKRQILITTSATLTPTSSAVAPSRVSDERQIIRVAQPISPKHPPHPQGLIAPNGGPQPLPGVFDYMTNKIKEEMKKQGEEGGNPIGPAGLALLAAGQKRPSPGASPGGHLMDKKAKMDHPGSEDHKGVPHGVLGVPRPAVAGVPPVPESPGSPGDMVIDESSETTPKAASPAVMASSLAAAAASSAGPPEGSVPSGNPGGTNPNAGNTSSKYEPLSDDE